MLIFSHPPVYGEPYEPSQTLLMPIELGNYLRLSYLVLTQVFGTSLARTSPQNGCKIWITLVISSILTAYDGKCLGFASLSSFHDSYLHSLSLHSCILDLVLSASDFLVNSITKPIQDLPLPSLLWFAVSLARSSLAQVDVNLHFKYIYTSRDVPICNSVFLVVKVVCIGAMWTRSYLGV
jgi:hypothetical protein